MTRMKHCLLGLVLLFWCTSVMAESALFQTFSNPEMKYRPQVRWWWNGDKVTAHEILRELDVMKEAGIGGVEINPIAFPGGDSIGIRTLEWCSPEWCQMVKVAVDGCRDRGMVADMIVGSGWPFGSEYLPREQQQQLLTIETFELQRGQQFQMNVQDILARVNPPIHSPYPNPDKELVFLRLMPKCITDFTEGISYDHLVGSSQITVTAPSDGDYVLYCFVKLTGFMSVINGAPGAQGPVLNHYDKNAAQSYLNRLSSSLTPVMGNMGAYMRAAFCDSFETEGSNWDDYMRDEFLKRRGYDISPYLPYVIFKVGTMGNPVREKYGSEMALSNQAADLIERVRNDFERTMRERFLEGFLTPFNQWCAANELKSRIQAYGRGLHPVESSMILDIPECETWMRPSTGYTHIPFGAHPTSYSINNKLTASGSFLAGNNIVSCEEQTNTTMVFFTTLDNIKMTGDMSNLSGVNQSILHGFNYTPAETPFPGWVRYGCYFNEKNSWWPHFRLWADYKARLSALFQNTVMQADIAILPAFEDMWSKLGGQRDPFPDHIYPVYAYHLWEAIHQSGSNCDYISEMILEKGKVKKGQLVYGSRQYNTLLLTKVESMSPAAARKLRAFVKSGGKVICIEKSPCKSYGLKDAKKRDAAVQKAISGLAEKYPSSFAVVNAPTGDDMLAWWISLQQKYGINQDIIFSQPGVFLSQNHYKSPNEDIFFVTNYSATQDNSQTLRFPHVSQDKKAWIWDAETGKRYLLPDWQDGLELYLQPEESKLIVFSDETDGEPYRDLRRNGEPKMVVSQPWRLHLHHAITGEGFDVFTEKLFDLSADSRTQTFAGDIEYTTTIEVDDPASISILDAGDTNHSVTELILNGRSLGRKWYGYRMWDVSGMLHKGQNEITLRCTTTLGNYVKSLRDNPVAQRWTRGQRVASMGLLGPVSLCTSDQNVLDKVVIK